MIKHLLRRCLILAVILPILSAKAQQREDVELPKIDTRNLGLYPKKPDEALYNFKVGGFYRFFTTYTKMDNRYVLNEQINDSARLKSLFVGDDSQLPMLNLNFSGRPNNKTAWGFDLFAFQFLDGNFGATYGTGQVSPANRPSVYSPLTGTRLATNLGLLLGINMYGNFTTDVGVFSVKTGGIHWTSLSDLTLKAFTGYNRFLLFERNPWDPIQSKVADRYDKYYGQGNINQDIRWGEKAFTGTIFEGSALPGNTSFKLLYGKTELNGGFLTIPNLSYGGQVKKAFSDGYVAVNTMNNQTYMDSLNNLGIGFNIATLELKKGIIPGIQVSGEVGAGQYFSPMHDRGWGEAISLKLNVTKKLIKIPFELHYYRMSPKVINNNAIFFNSAIQEASSNNRPAGTVGSTAALVPFASALTPIGQFTNNRQGLNINLEYKFDNLQVSLANGIASEIEGLSNQISFNNPVNQLTRSRLWRWNFPTSVGPYGRYNVIFRDVYQLLTVTDSAVAKKFNVIEVQGKYRTRLAGRELFLFYLGRYSSVQDFLSPITVFTEEAYLRHYSSELELFYGLNQKTVFTGYLGYERILANYSTQVNATTRRPLNQTGWGVGIGIDYKIAKNTALFLRHRWFDFKDSSFKRDAFSGQESIVELKFSF